MVSKISTLLLLRVRHADTAIWELSKYLFCHIYGMMPEELSILLFLACRGPLYHGLGTLPFPWYVLWH